MHLNDDFKLVQIKKFAKLLASKSLESEIDTILPYSKVNCDSAADLYNVASTVENATITFQNLPFAVYLNQMYPNDNFNHF